MKLATIEKITKVYPHPNADALELVEVLGYQAVVPIGQHKEGELIVYIQPDTVLPKDQEWAEKYLQYSPKRVKAVKLRGEFSEGIVVPLNKWEGDTSIFTDGEIGMEVSDAIGVIKYEPQVPKNESAVGGLPYQICKTYEERFENMMDKIPYGEKCDVTLKIDGQSTTHGYHVGDERYFLTGRRFEINPDEDNRYSVHTPKVREKIEEFCKKEGVSLAFRGESYGNSIQGFKINPHSSKPHSLAFFSIYNVGERKYETKGSKYYFVNVCKELGFEMVDILEEDVVLTPELIEKYSKGIKKLPNGNYFEGVVINHAEGSFKVINKHYDANK